MRHQKHRHTLGLKREHRVAMVAALASALFRHRRIETTLAKATELQACAEKIISLARVGPEGTDGKFPLNNFRRCLAVLTKKDVCFKLFNEVGPRFANRPGGYTRIYKLAKVRQGDAAPMAVIALLGENEQIKAPTRPALVTA